MTKTACNHVDLRLGCIHCELEAGSQWDRLRDEDGALPQPATYSVVFTFDVEVTAHTSWEAREIATDMKNAGLLTDVPYAEIQSAELIPDPADGPPCSVCGVYPGDPHNPEAHVAEMRADEDAMYERQFDDPYDHTDDPDEDWKYVDGFDTEEEARAFMDTVIGDSTMSLRGGPTPPAAFIEHNDDAAHERWLDS